MITRAPYRRYVKAWGVAMMLLMLTACGAEQTANVVTPSDVASEASTEDQRCPVTASDEEVVAIDTAEVVDFNSLDEMVRNSDLTITGTVETIEKGSRIGAEGEEPSDYIARLINVRVDEVLSQSGEARVEAGDIVTITEPGWLADDGRPVVLDNYPQMCIGDNGLWSLSKARLSKGKYVHGIAQVFPFAGAEVADTARAIAVVDNIEQLRVDQLVTRARRAGSEGP